MPTTNTIATGKIGADTPIWDAEFAARWDELHSPSTPSPKAAPVKRKPARTPTK